MRLQAAGGPIGRREVIVGLALAGLLPRHASAQALPAIGFLSSRSPAESEAVVAAFHRGLMESGFAIERNVAVRYRWAEGRYDRLAALANELVASRVNLIFAAGGPPAAVAAKAATAEIPIVFSAADDPVSLGLVSSLSQPGGNITGMSLFNAALSAKRLALLHEFLPAARVVGFLTNPANPGNRLELQAVHEAAKERSIEVQILNASTEQEIAAVFSTLPNSAVQAVIVAGEPFFDSRRALIVELAARYAIPASYSWRENVVLGGLFSYGTDLSDSYRKAAVYCGRILKGESPANLPVMQPTKFEFVINIKTAKALGLTVSPLLLTAADEVIE